MVVGLGELLWDLLPQGRQLGGAPANFAYHVHQLGDRGWVVSRLGGDELGREARERLRERGLSTEQVQEDPVHPTGTVEVTLDAAGRPEFRIAEGVAWDFLQLTPDLVALARRSQAVCYGSLAQRSPVSRAAVRGFLDSVSPDCVRIYDVNLRGRFYNREVLEGSLARASVVKLNHQEHPVVADLLGLEAGDPAVFARQLRRRYRLDLVCLTRGEQGCVLFGPEGTCEHPGFPVEVRDTVGAGDAFTAAVAYHLLRGSPLEVLAAAANRLGSWVASRSGAMPEMEEAALEEVRRPGCEGKSGPAVP